ncbi:MAG: hypothetical protein F6J98_02690 [Moorea sp. SIO4G2]|nr:hypothetical protein [Moorena sp. SIO4G2]
MSFVDSLATSIAGTELRLVAQAWRSHDAFRKTTPSILIDYRVQVVNFSVVVHNS